MEAAGGDGECDEEDGKGERELNSRKQQNRELAVSNNTQQKHSSKIDRNNHWRKMEEWYERASQPVSECMEALQQTLEKEEAQHGWESGFIANLRRGGDRAAPMTYNMEAGGDKLKMMPEMPCAFWDQQLHQLCIDSNTALEHEIVRDNSMPFEQFTKEDNERHRVLAERMCQLSEESKAPPELPMAMFAQRRRQAGDEFEPVV
jgi:hypothetical protein